jgi:hypothetical protein
VWFAPIVMGTPATTIAADGQVLGGDIAFSEAGTSVFWIDRGDGVNTAMVRYVPIGVEEPNTGYKGTDLLPSPVNEVLHLVADETGAYFIVTDDASVRWVAASQAPRTIAINQTGITALTTDDTYVYWAVGQEIRRAPKYKQ